MVDSTATGASEQNSVSKVAEVVLSMIRGLVKLVVPSKNLTYAAKDCEEGCAGRLLAM